MSTDLNELEDSTVLSPDKAFNALGNETRIQILRALGESEGPVPFSELHKRVGGPDSGNFNYHLGKLEGHFIRKSDEGYELRQAGRRIVEAVLSGAVTEDPILEPTQIDKHCPYCGAPIKVSYYQERLGRWCTECGGAYGYITQTDDPTIPENRGLLGFLSLPPAGLKGRTPEEVYQAAHTWVHLDFMSMATGLCPSCSGPLDHSVVICENHDATDGLCEECNNRYAVNIHIQCTNCILAFRGVFIVHLLANRELLAFLTTHGINPITDDLDPAWGWEYDEEILSVDPFEARFILTVDDDSITLTVDDDLNIVGVVTSGY